MSLRPLANLVCDVLPPEGGDCAYFAVVCEAQLGSRDPPTPLARRSREYSTSCVLKHVPGKESYRPVEGSDEQGRRIQTHDRNNDAEVMVPAIMAIRSPSYLDASSVHGLCRSRVSRGFPFELPNVRAHVEGFCPSFKERSVPFDQMACGMKVVFAEAVNADNLADRPGEFLLRSSIVLPFERASFCVHCSQLSSWTDARQELGEDAVRGDIKVTPAEYDILTKVFCRHALPKKAGSETVHQAAIGSPAVATRSTPKKAYPVFFVDLQPFADDYGQPFVTLDFTVPARAAGAFGSPSHPLAQLAAFVYETYVPFPRRFGVFVHPRVQRLMVWTLDTSLGFGLLRECYPCRDGRRDKLAKILRSVREAREKLLSGKASPLEAVPRAGSSSSSAVLTPRQEAPSRASPSPPPRPVTPPRCSSSSSSRPNVESTPAGSVRPLHTGPVPTASGGSSSSVAVRVLDELLRGPSPGDVQPEPAPVRDLTPPPLPRPPTNEGYEAYYRSSNKRSPAFDHYARYDSNPDAVPPLPAEAADHGPRSRSRSPRRVDPPQEVVAIPSRMLEGAAASIRTSRLMSFVEVWKVFYAMAKLGYSVRPPRLHGLMVRGVTGPVEQDYNDLYGPSSAGSYVAPGVLHGDPDVVRASVVSDSQLSVDESQPGSQTFQTAPSLPAWALFFAGVDSAPLREAPAIPPQYEPRKLSFYGLLAGSRNRPDLSWVDSEVYVRGLSPQWQDVWVDRWLGFWEVREDVFPDGCANVRGFNVMCTPVAAGFVTSADELASADISGCVLVLTGLAAGPRRGSDARNNGWVPFAYEILDWCLAGGLPVRIVLNHTDKAIVRGPEAMSRMRNEASLVFCCPEHASAAIFRFASLNAVRPLIPNRRLYVFRSDKAWSSTVRDAHDRWTGLTFEEVRAVLVATFQAARARQLGRFVPPDMLSPRPWVVDYWGQCTDAELVRAQHQEATPAFRLHFYARHAGSRDALLYLSAVASHFQDPANPYRSEGPLTDTTIGSLLDDVTECGRWMSGRGSRPAESSSGGSPRVIEID
ncbi:hypothetical protein FOZ60_013734 [Perkinsus olseni]|uniref:Uncharacterized protein n=1 Tax=Perkinsus olseni TaxID=32597 RepID=A0A7J6N946_PEROL|nr:hypothetical protein FOZ60_013734 [Perkinsus olseni]